MFTDRVDGGRQTATADDRRVERDHGRVIVGVEDAEHDVASLRWAASYAQARGLPVLLVHGYRLLVVPALPVGYVSPVLHAEEQRESAEAVTARAVLAVRELGVDASGVTVSGDAGTSLVDAAYAGDLLVLGTAGGGALRHAVRGGTVHTVLHRGRCPVVVVPAGWEPSSSDDRVVLGDDGTAAARSARAWAEREWGEAVVDVVRVDEANAVERLLTAASGARLLVIGNHPTGWLAAVTGHGLSELAVLDPPCPVAVVPGP